MPEENVREEAIRRSKGAAASVSRAVGVFSASPQNLTKGTQTKHNAHFAGDDHPFIYFSTPTLRFTILFKQSNNSDNGDES